MRTIHSEREDSRWCCSQRCIVRLASATGVYSRRVSKVAEHCIGSSRRRLVITILCARRRVARRCDRTTGPLHSVSGRDHTRAARLLGFSIIQYRDTATLRATQLGAMRQRAEQRTARRPLRRRHATRLDDEPDQRCNGVLDQPCSPGFADNKSPHGAADSDNGQVHVNCNEA